MQIKVSPNFKKKTGGKVTIHGCNKLAVIGFPMAHVQHVKPDPGNTET